MPVASLPEIMDRAFEKRYGVAAFNTVDDITMQGVISAAEQSKSPLIVQISVKTVKFWGAEVVKHMFTDMAARAAVPVALHLDHCPDPAVAKTCRRLLAASHTQTSFSSGDRPTPWLGQPWRLVGPCW